MMQACVHIHEFTESERIRKIIWIIFSAINNINSALHLTQTYCIPPDRTATATHYHLDYFWNCFLHFCNKSGVSKFGPGGPVSLQSLAPTLIKHT